MKTGVQREGNVRDLGQSISTKKQDGAKEYDAKEDGAKEDGGKDTAKDFMLCACCKKAAQQSARSRLLNSDAWVHCEVTGVQDLLAEATGCYKLVCT